MSSIETINYIKKEKVLFIFNYEEIKRYEEIAIFVQKRNDLDTCCCAAAMANLIKDHFPNTNISIIGLNSVTRFFRKNISKFRDKPINWSKKVLVILSEICNNKEISKENLELINKADKIWLVDHHEGQNSIIKEFEYNKEIKVFKDAEQTSACEVFLQMVRNWNSISENKWNLSQKIVEMIFGGIFMDSYELLNANASTYENINYLCQNHNFCPKEIIENLYSRPITHLKLLATVIENAEFERNLIYLSLRPEMVWKYLPRHMQTEHRRIKRKKMLTWIPRAVEKLCQVNTIIFCHYSLYEPYNREKKFVYITLKKANPGLESVLQAKEFKQVKNTWSREMSLDDLSCLIERYKELFVS